MPCYLYLSVNMHWSCIFTYTIHLVHLQAKFIFPSWMLFEGPLGQSDKLRKVAITAAVMEEHQSGGSKQFCKVILTGLWLGLSTSTLQNPKNTRWWTCVLTVHLDEWFWAAWNHTLLVNLSLRFQLESRGSLHYLTQKSWCRNLRSALLWPVCTGKRVCFGA